MIEFVDGPAAGVKLRLRRAPILLRAVRSARGAWDALDQLDDTPREGESITVYLRATEVGWMHILVRGKNRAAGGVYLTARYRVLQEQPEQDQVRETVDWWAWVEERLPSLRVIHDRYLAEEKTP